MDERSKRRVKLVVALVVLIAVIAFGWWRKGETERLVRTIGYGRPAQQRAALLRLIKKKKAPEALADRFRCVMENATQSAGELGNDEDIFEFLAFQGKFDGTVGGRAEAQYEPWGEVMLPILTGAVQDKDGGRRAATRPKYKLLGPKKAIPALLGPIHYSRAPTRVEDYDFRLAGAWDDYVRAEVSASLAQMPPDAAFPFISIHGMVKPPPKVTAAQFLRMKSTASAGLTAMGAAAFDPIVNVMLKLPNPEARAEGAHLLGAVADQTVLPPAAPLADDKAQVVVAPLIRLLTSDPEWTVQQRAAASLGLLALSKQKLAAGEDMTVPVIRAKCVAIKDGALPPLIAALRHPRTEVRAAAAQALGMLRDPVAAQPLVDTLVNRRHGAAAEIGMALERLGTPAIAPLVPALGNPEDEVRLVATRTIAAIGSRAAIHPLAGRLRDANVLVRQAAARALKAIFKLEKDPTVVGDLQAALNDSDWRVYEDARDALTNLGEAGAPALVAALGSPDIRVAFTAQQGLTAIGLPAAPRLLDALGSGQGGTALWAAVALGDMGPNVAGQVSTVMLDTARPPQARAFAAEALGRTGFKGATKGLLAAMRDPDPDVRSRAAEALGRLNQADATQAIVDALRDSHVDVQDAALDALRSWTDSEVDKKLGPLASSAPEDRLKRLAAVAIVLRFLASLEPNADVATVDVRELGAHVKVLAEAAADQTERERVRRVAVTGLGFSGGEAELKVLERLLVPGGPYATRAAVAIARIAKRTAPPARPGEVPTSPATDILLKALPKAQTPDLRLALAGGLAELGQISAQPMVEALAKATGTDRTWLVAILAANGKPAVEPMLETRGRARKAQDVPYWEALDTAMLLTRNSQAREVMDAQPLKQPAPKEFQDTTRQLYIAIMRERAGVEG